MISLSTRTKFFISLKRRLPRQEKRKRIWVRKILREGKQKWKFHLLIKELRLHKVYMIMSTTLKEN